MSREKQTGGFTLIELLVIIAIICAMTGVAVLSVGSGRQSAHMRNAVRSALSFSRHARSMALLKQKPVILTYSEEKGEDEVPGGRIELEYGLSEAASGGGASASNGAQMRTVTGRLCEADPDDGEAPADWGASAQSVENMGEEPREFPGVRLKIELLDDGAGASRTARQTSISVFSNVDYLRGKTGRRASGGEADRRKRLGRTTTADDDGEETEERKLTDPVRVTFEPNGRCVPHRVTLYRDGAAEDSGASFTVDRFGSIKVDGEDDGK